MELKHLRNSTRELWQQHKQTPFPKGCRGKEVEGIDLVVLGADIAGCVSTYLGRKSIDVYRVAILGLCLNRLSKVLPNLQGEAHDYFENLTQLAEHVLLIVAKESANAA